MTEKTTGKKRLVLLDAHAILHRAYHALPDFTAPDGQPTGALYGVVTMVLKIIEEFKPDYVVACFDLPEPTYRHEVYADYNVKDKKPMTHLLVRLNVRVTYSKLLVFQFMRCRGLRRTMFWELLSK